MSFIHIRERGTRQWERAGKAGITVHYRIGSTTPNGQSALVGMSFCSPKERTWNRLIGNKIAKDRSVTSPILFQFHSLDRELTRQDISATCRTLLISNPSWTFDFEDSETIRPSRYTSRKRTQVIGPEGSWVNCYIEGNKIETNVINVEAGHPVLEFRHWALRVPGWARKLVRSEWR